MVGLIGMTIMQARDMSEYKQLHLKQVVHAAACRRLRLKPLGAMLRQKAVYIWCCIAYSATATNHDLIIAHSPWKHYILRLDPAACLRTAQPDDTRTRTRTARHIFIFAHISAFDLYYSYDASSFLLSFLLSSFFTKGTSTCGHQRWSVLF